MPRRVKVPRKRQLGVPPVQGSIFSALVATNSAVGCCAGVEEIGGAQVREEHGLHRGVGEVFIGDTGHVDDEAGAFELAFAQVDFAAAEAHGAAVVIEKIGAGPADDALGSIDGEGALGDGRLGALAGAFEGQTGLGPAADAGFKT